MRRQFESEIRSVTDIAWPATLAACIADTSSTAAVEVFAGKKQTAEMAATEALVLEKKRTQLRCIA
jgi:hypothetical protein